MKREYTFKHGVAASLGAGCLIVETWMNAQELHERVNNWADSSILAGVAVCFGAAFALAAAAAAWHQRAFVKALFLLTAFLIGAAFQGATTLDRIGTQRDAKLSQVWKADSRWVQLDKIERDMRYEASRECSKVGPSGRSRGPRCDAVENEAEVAKRLRLERESELDSLGQRIAAMIPLLTVRQASLYVPCLLPVALFLLANALLAFGLDGREIEPEFSFELKGRAADTARARRFIEGYVATNGRNPTIADVAQATGVKDYTAAKLLREAA